MAICLGVGVLGNARTKCDTLMVRLLTVSMILTRTGFDRAWRGFVHICGEIFSAAFAFTPAFSSSQFSLNGHAKPIYCRP